MYRAVEGDGGLCGVFSGEQWCGVFYLSFFILIGMNLLELIMYGE